MILSQNAGPERLEPKHLEEVAIGVPEGRLSMRPEQPDDEAFRFALFCNSRPAEFALLRLDAAGFEQLMGMQFHGQNVTYRANFPDARFDIIELDGKPIGRIVVNRPGDHIHIVDQAIVPPLRNRGLGTAIMRTLMNEAAAAGKPVRLKVASSNDPSMRLYARLGFVPIHDDPLYIEMEWRALSGTEGAASLT
jgi:ribosomal protein S18 acetylase RimI-like enzyme